MATLLDSIFTAEQACDGHVSISQVLCYLRCPESYRHRYILGETEPPTSALLEGSAHHQAFEHANRHCVDRDEHIPVAEHVEYFADTFTRAVHKADDEVVWEDGEDSDSVVARGRKLIEAYHANVAGTIAPLDVEVRIDANVGGTPLLGYADLIARVDDREQPVVIDYKTAKRAKSEADLANDLQMAIYSWALGIEHLSFVTLCKTKVPKVEVVMATISPEQQAWAVRVVESVVTAIQAGVFPPCDPSAWICSPRFCGHWSRCRGCVNAPLAITG